jgi:hypothetical protein
MSKFESDKVIKKIQKSESIMYEFMTFDVKTL